MKRTRSFFAATMVALVLAGTTVSFASPTTNTNDELAFSNTVVRTLNELDNDGMLNALHTAAIRKLTRYPQEAINRREEGRFDILVFLDEQGNIKAINYELRNPNDDPQAMRHIMAAAMQAVREYRFPAEFNSTTIRVPFNFFLVR
jgi:TonB family protein